MSIKWIDDGADSAWEVRVGPRSSRARLIVARKCGGKEAAYRHAREVEAQMKAARPTRLQRLKGSLVEFWQSL